MCSVIIVMLFGCECLVWSIFEGVSRIGFTEILKGQGLRRLGCFGWMCSRKHQASEAAARVIYNHSISTLFDFTLLYSYIVSIVCSTTAYPLRHTADSVGREHGCEVRILSQPIVFHRSGLGDCCCLKGATVMIPYLHPGKRSTHLVRIGTYLTACMLTTLRC